MITSSPLALVKFGEFESSVQKRDKKHQNAMSCDLLRLRIWWVLLNILFSSICCGSFPLSCTLESSRLTICSTKAKSCCSQPAENQALPSTKNLAKQIQISELFRAFQWCSENVLSPRCAMLRPVRQLRSAKKPEIAAVPKAPHASVEVFGHAQFRKRMEDLQLHLQRTIKIYQNTLISI